MSRALGLVAALPLLFSLGCASDAPRPLAGIGLSLSIPKALIDVDKVTLYVYPKEAVSCSGATITVPPTDNDRVFELELAKCNANKSWCGTGKLEKNPDQVLTFYVEGKFAAKKGGFTGCVERAVDQDPVQISMQAQPIVEGGKCGDAAIGYGESCEGVTDEACDATKCQTKEVILSNGAAARDFFRGRPGRKSGLQVRWVGDKFYGVWSDEAMGSAGADGSHEITARMLKDTLITETSPVVLASEVRLPASGGPTTDGRAKRGGPDTAPTWVPLQGGNFLFVFLKSGTLTSLVTDSKFAIPATGDTVVSPGAAAAPHAAVANTGDVLIVFLESGVVRSVLRKADGTLSPFQLVGSGMNTNPRVAFVGGEFMVVWSNGDDIKGRRVGIDGTPKGSELTINQAKTAGAQTQPDIAGFDTGEFIVVWKDAAGDVGADIRIQKFDKAGVATGNEIAAVVNDKVKDGDQDQPTVAAGRSPGGLRYYLVAWRTTNNIAARFVKVDEQGYFISHIGSSLSEFNVGVDARPRSSPSVAIGTATAPYCAVAWSDDAEGDAAGDDDRVRVRRIPPPDPPK